MSIYHSPFLHMLRDMPPEQEVCQQGRETLYNKQLIERSLGIAAYLSEQGIKRGDHVLFAVDGGIEFLEVFMALIHLRAKVALVDPHMGPQLYQSKIQQFQPKWAFIDRRLLLLQEQGALRFAYQFTRKNALYIPPSTDYTVFATGMQVPLRKKYLPIETRPYPTELKQGDLGDEVVIVYTSGTLAEPKGVVQNVESLYHGLQALAELFQKGEQEAMVSHLPHFALIGMNIGYKTHFWKENLSQGKRVKFIEQHKVTTMFGPPAEFLEMMRYCSHMKRKFPASLKHLILGSAPILTPFLKNLRQYYDGRITCLYGMTEHVIVAAIDGDEKLQYQGPEDLLGKPFGGMEYKIAEDGELLIRSDLLFKRYLHLPDRPEFHPTGDLVKRNEAGQLLMMGRKKNMIIRGSKNIYPALYEGTIASIPGVHEACMIGVYNAQKHDEEVFLLVDAVQSLKTEEISKQLKRGPHAIDSDALPDHIIRMEIPKSGRQQKVNYQFLREHLAAKMG